MGGINCTAALRNLLGGRCSPLSVEEIEGEIKDVTEYVKNNKVIIESNGFFRVHGGYGLEEYKKEMETIADAEKYVSEFKRLLTELIRVKQKNYTPLRTWKNELVF